MLLLLLPILLASQAGQASALHRILEREAQAQAEEGLDEDRDKCVPNQYLYR